MFYHKIMKTIAFGLQKGGTGKTSISVSVACELAKTSKVLLIDGDPQGNASSWLLKELEFEFADLLQEANSKKIEECISKTNIKNLDMLATFGEGGRLGNYRDSAIASNKPFQIKKILQTISDKYDYCIIDTSPSNSPLERNLFFASDEIIPVLQLNQFSVDGLQIFISKLKEWCSDFNLETINIKSIVLNAKDSRISFQNNTLSNFSDMTDKFSFYVFPTDTIFNKAQKENLPIQSMKNLKQETIETLKDLVEEILK